MKKILMMSVLILVSSSLMAAEEVDNKEQKVTATAKFKFVAGDILSQKEMSEKLRQEQQRNQQLMESLEKRDMQKSRYIEEFERAKNK